MADLSRNEQLRQSAQRYISVHEEWQRDPNGGEFPGDAYWSEVVSLIEVANAGPIPGGTAKLGKAIGELSRQHEAFMDNDNPDPGNAFYAAMGEVRKHMHSEPEPLKRPPETFEMLKEQGVGIPQVASIYEITVDEVVREYKTPGSVITEDWVLPSYRRWREENDRLDRQIKVAPVTVGTACPETPEELFEQGLTAEQAAATLSMDLESVQAIWLGLNESADGAGAEPVPITPEPVSQAGEAETAESPKVESPEISEEVKELRGKLDGLGVPYSKAAKAPALQRKLEAAIANQDTQAG